MNDKQKRGLIELFMSENKVFKFNIMAGESCIETVSIEMQYAVINIMREYGWWMVE